MVSSSGCSVLSLMSAVTSGSDELSSSLIVSRDLSASSMLASSFLSGLVGAFLASGSTGFLFIVDSRVYACVV